MSPHDRRALLTAVAVAVGVCSLITIASSGTSPSEAAALAAGAEIAVQSPSANVVAEDAMRVPGTPVIAPTTTIAAGPTTVAASATTEEPGLDGAALTSEAQCLMTVMSLRQGQDGASVKCLQEALAAAGAYSGPISGVFDGPTFTAVEKVQAERNLYVDGIVGRETALSLAIWPDEESLVVRTPKPPAGAKDLLGYTLSSVAVSGPSAPPMPEHATRGKRLVYDRAGQRVWAVDGNERIVRSWLVAGSKYANEIPGVHKVYSKSEVSTAWNGTAYLPLMVRWLKTERGAIGFHGIPTYVSNGDPYMTDAELGQRLSGGCQRQADIDAKFTWDFADIGTTVVVL